MFHDIMNHFRNKSDNILVNDMGVNSKLNCRSNFIYTFVEKKK